MIKFFRKIRQQLISEGKTGKYLKYAMGEIVLVVVGILIALQVNQWNEGRKNKALLDSYTTSLINDLKQDTIVLNRLIKYSEDDNATLKRLGNRLSTENANIDTLKKIVRHELVLDYKAYRPPNGNTLLAMQSNGTIEFYDEETYGKLIELQTFQNIVGSIIKGGISTHKPQSDNLLSKYSTSEFNVIRNGPLLEQAWKNVDINDLYRSVESFMTSKNLMNTFGNKRRIELLKLTEEVLSRLIKIQENGVK